MCIALFSDIHGNIRAFDAVLADTAADLFFGGDHHLTLGIDIGGRRVDTPAQPTSAGFCAANTRG